MEVDSDRNSRQRVLDMEIDFRNKAETHLASLPSTDVGFADFKTNPFVLLIHAKHRKYSEVHQIEPDIALAKRFSSMETSTGKMVEEVVLPKYGWETVPSGMHTAMSVLDGRATDTSSGVLRVATLKSGPATLNDDMSGRIADNIVQYARQWAQHFKVQEVEFIYGTLYGTKKRSNKKDWHILRNVAEKATTVTRQPNGIWECSFQDSGVRVNVLAKLGHEWWEYLGGSLTFIEVGAAMIRACVEPSSAILSTPPAFTIPSLEQIVSMDDVPDEYNVSILQRGQIPWLFLFAWHLFDDVI